MAWVSFLSQAWRGHKRGHRLAATSGLAPLHLARACVIRRVKITRPWMRILPEHWPRITGVPLDALLTGGIGQGSRQFVTYRIKCSRTNILSNFTTHKFKTCERQPVNKRTLSTQKTTPTIFFRKFWTCMSCTAYGFKNIFLDYICIQIKFS